MFFQSRPPLYGTLGNLCYNTTLVICPKLMNCRYYGCSRCCIGKACQRCGHGHKYCLIWPGGIWKLAGTDISHAGMTLCGDTTFVESLPALHTGKSVQDLKRTFCSIGPLNRSNVKVFRWWKLITWHEGNNPGLVDFWGLWDVINGHFSVWLGKLPSAGQTNGPPLRQRRFHISGSRGPSYHLGDSSPVSTQ